MSLFQQYENPMISFQCCGCYTVPFFEECFAMELVAVKIVIGEMGLRIVETMITFVRTLDMAKDVNRLLEMIGLNCGGDGLKVNMMAELPGRGVPELLSWLLHGNQRPHTALKCGTVRLPPPAQVTVPFC
ncbi:ppsA [Symbiodinium pilosum]|uniref:PpsA protein n=1 Tax=Symbiodinium pilosum TaxID=2952 RepID=A0A812LZR8_SYMPI|nr:ppsA [Symbiodinium pilosum]